MRGHASALLVAVDTAFARRRMFKRVPSGRFFEVFLFGVGGVPIKRVNAVILSLIHCVDERFGLLRDSIKRIHVPSKLLIIVLRYRHCSIVGIK